MKLAARTVLALAAALALSGCQKASDDVFGQRVRAYLLAHPEVIREAAMKLNENERVADQKRAEALLPKLRAQVERDPRDFVANPNGTITVTEFYDYRCPHCGNAAPKVINLIRANPDVRFVFKEMPIFGEVSDTASKIALTPSAKSKALDLYQGWMAEKALDEAAIDRHLASVGLDPAAVRKASADPAIARHIADTHALASALKIEGTPAFVVGDTLIPGADMAALRAAITVAKAGELKTLS
jgi:protein-disulfide isomerase